MSDAYEVKRVVRATPKRLFEAWLDSGEHSSMTGRAATVGAEVGEESTVLDGLITARNLEIEPYHRIVQVWTTEMPGVDAFDSRFDLVLSTTLDSGAIANAHDEGTTVAIGHSGLPPSQTLFNAEWWEDHYFRPMDAYFAQKNRRFMRPSR